ncbi:MAG: hypothetical protein JWR06_768, partial [Jatrophihabitans sp.]|nr:hypothetical protein [Jatrophihabitans sp.]
MTVTVDKPPRTHGTDEVLGVEGLVQ